MAEKQKAAAAAAVDRAPIAEAAAATAPIADAAAAMAPKASVAIELAPIAETAAATALKSDVAEIALIAEAAAKAPDADAENDGPAAAAALRHLREMYNDEHCQSTGSCEDVCRYVISNMSSFARNLAIQQQGCRVMVHLVRKDCRRCLALGAVEALVSAMTHHPAEQTLQCFGLIALSDMCQQDGSGRESHAQVAEACARIGACGGAKAIVTAMRNVPASDPCQLKLMILINHLSIQQQQVDLTKAGRDSRCHRRRAP